MCLITQAVIDAITKLGIKISREISLFTHIVLPLLIIFIFSYVKGDSLDWFHVRLISSFEFLSLGKKNLLLRRKSRYIIKK